MTASRGADAPRRPTLDMVAQEAGVTRSTVSRAINGEPDVSSATIKVVEDAIAKLGYVPNQAARALVSRRSMAIALIIPESADMFLDDPHLVTLMAGASHRLEESDYILSLIVNAEDPNGKLMRYLSSGAIDGGLIASHHNRNDELMGLRNSFPDRLRWPPHRRPVARQSLGRRRQPGRGRPGDPASHRHRPSADRHHHRSPRHAVGHRAPRRVARRRDGGRVSTIRRSSSRTSGAPAGREAARRLFERFPDLDGVFVANDTMANSVIAVLLQEGRSVPGDVAVVGFDDSTVAQLGPVPLTTVRQPSLDMGWRMADLLLRTIDGEEVEQANMMTDRARGARLRVSRRSGTIVE